MTLGELFQRVAENPTPIIFTFMLIPATALLAGWMGKDEGHTSPWKYLYSALIYIVSVPGIFAITLSIYLFLFERQSIFDTDIYLQVLPILSMIVTILIIRRNVDLNLIPGFDKLSGLVMMISATLAIMWFIDRTHIIVFSYIRFEIVLLIFAVLLVVIRFGWSRLVKG